MKKLTAIFIGLSVMAYAVIGETQQRPNPVAIWCQDSTGAYAPCQSGPTAAASADNVANQTTSFIHGLGFMFDGSTWDRLRGNSTDGLLVNLGTNNDVTVTSGTLAATQSGTWNLNNISGTISLPTGAATAALQDGIIKDGTGDTTEANVSSGRLHVDGSGVTQPVSGTVTANAGTNLNTSSLLTTTAHDAAFGTAGTADTQVRTVQGIASMTPLLVDGSGATQPVSGTVTVTDGAGALNVIVDSGTTAATQSGTWNINNVSGTISLPTGAATAANQDGIIKDGTGDTTQANVTSGNLNVNCVVGCSGGSTTPSDNFANPTDAGNSASFNFVWDGATWDRAPGTSADGLLVNLGGNNDVTVTSGSITANAGTNLNTSALALETGGNLATTATNTGNTSSGVGATGDAAATAGSTGSVNAKLRLATSQLGSIQTAVETIDNIVSGTGANISQMNGVNVTMGNGASGTGVQRVTIASDSTGTTIATQATAANLNVRTDASGATASAPPARANLVGGVTSGATGGLMTAFPVCDSYANVTVSTATTTLLVTGVSGRHVRICSLSLLTAAANNVALISGTGATCGTGTTGMTGGTTSGTGYNFAANGGLTQGNGIGTINRTNATGDSVCVITSAATQLSGRIAYTIY